MKVTLGDPMKLVVHDVHQLGAGCRVPIPELVKQRGNFGIRPGYGNQYTIPLASGWTKKNPFEPPLFSATIR